MRYVTKLLPLLLLALLLPVAVFASHAWGPYHWARTANPFTLKLGDNVSGAWDGHLDTAATDWSASSVLDLVKVGGNGGKNCGATQGRVEVCNRKYGNNGWLGLAQIWISGDHIVQGVAKMNDTYFNTASYNTPSWRQLVMCQEIAHAFGLDHQDEEFDNPNLGSCMDYTGTPQGNEHPNAHDFDQLVTIYGSHLDGFNSYDDSPPDSDDGGGPGKGNGKGNGNGGNPPEGFDSRADWGRQIKDNGNVGLYVRELEGGRKLFTHVFWAN